MTTTNNSKKIILLLLVLCLQTATAQVSFDKERLAYIKTWLAEAIDKNQLPGAVIMIADKNHSIFTHTDGFAEVPSKKPLAEDGLFKIASMSKVITTIAVLQLYEKGLLDLDDPMSMYFPSMANLGILESYDGESKKITTLPLPAPITVRHMLNQTSGIPYDGEIMSQIHADKGIDMFNPPQKNLEELVDVLVTLPVLHAPGEAFTYGPSTDILGRMVEILSGMDLESYFREYIFEPLEMQRTGFNVHLEHYDKVANGYGSLNGELRPLRKSFSLEEGRTYPVYLGGSGLISSAGDYLNLARMLLNKGMFEGKKVLSRKSVELMSSDQLNGVKYPQGFDSITGAQNTFGFGVNVITPQGSKKELYTSGTFYWEGALGTTFIVDPKEEFVAVFMTQLAGSSTRVMRKRFRQMIYQALN